eukprot:1141063-Pelagomonas_calceolata.AAC.9
MPRVFKLWGWRAPSDSQKKWQGNLKTDFVHQAKDPIRNGVLNPKTGLSLENHSTKKTITAGSHTAVTANASIAPHSPQKAQAHYNRDSGSGMGGTEPLWESLACYTKQKERLASRNVPRAQHRALQAHSCRGVRTRSHPGVNIFQSRKWSEANQRFLRATQETGAVLVQEGKDRSLLFMSFTFPSQKNQCHPYHPPSRCAKALASLEAAEAGSRVATDGVEAFMRSAKTKGS